MNCKESLEKLQQSFKPEIAGDLKAKYQFEISGNTGGEWTLTIENGKCDLKEGKDSSPSVTISISDQDWLSLQSGKLNSQMAFMMGKLRVAGDMGLAMKLQSMFPGQA